MERDPSWGLRVHALRSGPVVTVSLAGELDLASAPYLRQRLMPPAPGRVRTNGGRHGREFAVEPGADVVVDASELSFVDVAGLDALLDVAEAIRRSGGSFGLRSPSRQLQRLIRLLGLDGALLGEG